MAQEFRVYAIDALGAFADASFDFHADGRMTKAFEGWIRLAEVQAPEDREILDFHAAAVLVDWQLEVEQDGIIRSLGESLELAGTSWNRKSDDSRLIHEEFPLGERCLGMFWGSWLRKLEFLP